jgi:hypothetical protein
MSLEHRSDPPSFTNPVVTRADFKYSMTPTQIKIVDLNSGKASVTNDIENVLRKIEAWHQGSIAGYQIMYPDSDGYWDGIEWDGEHAKSLTIGGRIIGHRVQNFVSEALSGQVGWIGQECFIDRSQCQLRPVLRQQHLASAPVENAVLRKPR